MKRVLKERKPSNQLEEIMKLYKEELNNLKIQVEEFVTKELQNLEKIVIERTKLPER